MSSYVLQRLGQALLIGLIITATTFALVFVAKDPARALARPEATAVEIEALRARLGLDRPLVVQYGLWLGGVLRGDFGDSLYARQPVERLLAPRIRATLELASAAIVLTLLIGVPLGIAAALRRGGWVDLIATVIAVSGQAMPIFWFGLLMIVAFGVNLGWLPVSGRGTWQHLVLPAVTLAFSTLPLTMRLTRSAMLDVLGLDYVRTARAKGLPGHVTVWKHAARNAATPVVLATGLQLGALLGGTVVTETVFAWPGIGDLAVTAVTTADLPVVQAIVLFAAGVVIASNLAADVAVALFDPRVRY